MVYFLALPMAAVVYMFRGCWIAAVWTWRAMVATGRACRAVWRLSLKAAGRANDAMYHHRHRHDPPSKAPTQPTAAADMPTEAKIRFHLDDEDGALTRLMTTQRSTP